MSIIQQIRDKAAVLLTSLIALSFWVSTTSGIEGQTPNSFATSISKKANSVSDLRVVREKYRGG